MEDVGAFLGAPTTLYDTFVVSLDEESHSHLELDAASTALSPPSDDAFLEVPERSPGAYAARGRVATDEDLRVVNALADDAMPLLAALWPARPDLLTTPPTLDALRARVDFARTTLNLATRRGAEWRARAEVASAVLSRRLEALRRPPTPPGTLDEVILRAAHDELRAWHERALAELLSAEADEHKKIYAEGVRRITEEARRRGLDNDATARIATALGIELLPGELPPWTPCTTLPGAPRTLDAVAQALVLAPAQAVAALRDGSIVRWMRANRCPESLVAAALEAQRLAESDDPYVGVWSLAWDLGRDGVTLDGHTISAPETLLAHLRTARLHLSNVAAAGTVLARWFRRQGHTALASACEALARGEAHADDRLRWALGEPLRLGDRTVADPTALVREVLTRPSVRTAAIDRWRDGTLRVWLDTLPRGKRDALWLDALATPPAHPQDESAFWRVVYQRAPKAALRVVFDGSEGRVVRFQTVADLRATARLAVLWRPLQALLRSGELRAWLEAAAPGVDLETVGCAPDEDVALHELLAAIGHTGLVIPWGRTGFPITVPSDFVMAWRRDWQQVETALAKGYVGPWLVRCYPGEGIAGVTAERAIAAWGPTLGAGTAPPGVAALRLALLCGLDELPADPQRPIVRGSVRGYRTVDPSEHDREAWEPLLGPSSQHRTYGTALLWMARHVPAFTTLALDALDPARAEGCVEAIAAAGKPVATEPLATEHAVAERERVRLAATREAAMLSAEREAITLAVEREALRFAQEREAQRLAEELEAFRQETARERARLSAERDAARATLEQEIARFTAERELARLEAERTLAKALAERDAAVREAEREIARIAHERDEARREAEHTRARVLAERDSAVLEAERARLERDIARLEVEQAHRRLQHLQASLDQEAAEREALRLHRLEVARQAALDEEQRLRALEAARQEEAAREAARMAEREAEAREAAARQAAWMAERNEEALRRALAEQERLAALEEEARREAARQAEEAAALAQRLAEEARRREHAAREAEELSRRLLREREAAREAAWAARRAAAEREIARLLEAEQRARALANELTKVETEEPEAPAEIAALAELDAVLDPSPETQDATLDAQAVAVGPPDRREIRTDALLESRPFDETSLARIRAAVIQWARASGYTTDHGHGGALQVDGLEAKEKSVFEVHVTTRMETRTLSLAKPPWREDDLIAVPPEATLPGATVDPWALELPEVDTWTSWRGEFLLDTPAVKTSCSHCEDGIVACASCEGTGDRACTACQGRAKVRCPRCAGTGELSTQRGMVKCGVCEGWRKVPCPACRLGRVTCEACHGAKRTRCPTCRGVGHRVERLAVTQEYRGIAAVTVVGPGVPEDVLARVRSRDADPLPVVHVEAASLDAFALARELPHPALAEAAAQCLSEEAARVVEPWRLTRQRLVVRRYPAAEVRCTLAGEVYTLWVHGLHDTVFATSSPKARRVGSLLAHATDALNREDVTGAVEILRALQELDPDDPQVVKTAETLGTLVLTMARRGDLVAARAAASIARSLRWAACVDRLMEAERELASRLQVQAPWALAEEARLALERGREARCIERLQQLAVLEPDHPEGARVAAALGRRLAEVAHERIARGELPAAMELATRARLVPFASCGDAMATVAVALDTALKAERRRRMIPWVLAAITTLVALAAVTTR